MRLLSVIAKKFLRMGGYNLVPSHQIPMDVRQMENLLYFGRSFSKISGMTGSIVECGVGKGRTLLYLSHLVSQENKGRKIWGFDSFEGFPEPSPEDASIRNPKKGEWAGTSEEDMRKILQRAGLQDSFVKSSVILVKGFVEKTLSQYDGSPIALLHIDLDLYEGYRVALENLFPKVIGGGLVLFDEYHDSNWPGATKAIDEYFKNSGYRILKDDGRDKFFVVKVRS